MESHKRNLHFGKDDIHFDATRGYLSAVDVCAYIQGRTPNHLLDRMRTSHASCAGISFVMARSPTDFTGKHKRKNSEVSHPAIESPEELVMICNELADLASGKDDKRRKRRTPMHDQGTGAAITGRILELVDDFPNTFPALWGGCNIELLFFSGIPSPDQHSSTGQVPMFAHHESNSAHTVCRLQLASKLISNFKHLCPRTSTHMHNNAQEPYRSGGALQHAHMFVMCFSCGTYVHIRRVITCLWTILHAGFS